MNTFFVFRLNGEATEDLTTVAGQTKSGSLRLGLAAPQNREERTGKTYNWVINNNDGVNQLLVQTS